MLSSVTHELWTPLNFLSSSTEILLLWVNTEKEKQLLKSMEVQILFLMSLIDDIMDLGWFDSGAFVLNSSTFRLSQLLDEIKLMFGNQT